jgi:hypothetical protein
LIVSDEKPGTPGRGHQGPSTYYTPDNGVTHRNGLEQ